MKKLLCLWLFVSQLLSAHAKEDAAMIEYKIYQGESIREFVPILNDWVVENYKKFPFLYIAQDEVPPNYVLCEDPDSFVLFAEKNGQKMAMISGHPLNSPHINVKYSPFRKLEEMQEKGYDPDKILYVACFLVADEERQNHSLIEQMYQQIVTLAKKQQKTQICYFTTMREENHPLKPMPYVLLEPWEDTSASFKNMGITFDLTWPTLQPNGSVEECSSSQTIYIQDL